LNVASQESRGVRISIVQRANHPHCGCMIRKTGLTPKRMRKTLAVEKYRAEVETMQI